MKILLIVLLIISVSFCQDVDPNSKIENNTSEKSGEVAEGQAHANESGNESSSQHQNGDIDQSQVGSNKVGNDQDLKGSPEGRNENGSANSSVIKFSIALALVTMNLAL